MEAQMELHEGHLRGTGGHITQYAHSIEDWRVYKLRDGVLLCVIGDVSMRIRVGPGVMEYIQADYEGFWISFLIPIFTIQSYVHVAHDFAPPMGAKLLYSRAGGLK